MRFIDTEQLVKFATLTKPPEWQTKLFERYRTEVQVHSKGKLFYKIDRLFPNEEPESKANRILAFEPVTKGSFLKGISNIMRIFSNSSYTAHVSEKTKEEITKTKYDDKNLFSFFLETWINNALGNDPNSLIVDYPDWYMEGRAYDKIYFVKSENIVYTDDETFVYKCEEESEVEYSIEQKYLQETEAFFDRSVNRLNRREALNKAGYTEVIRVKYLRTVYHVFTQNKFYRIEQDKEHPDQYITDEWTLENFKQPPVRFAGGSKAERNLYESFLSPFVPFGNLALIQHSQHTAVNFIFSFPRMSELQSPCPNKECKDGYVSDKESSTGWTACTVCNGRGYKAPQSPYKIYTPKYDPSGMTDQEASTVPWVQFYTPPVEVLDYSKNEWKGYLELAEMAIYVQQKVQTGNVQSAESKKYDLDELFAYLLKVSKVFYNNLQFVIQCEENYLNTSPTQVTVNIPFSFAILSEQEAFDALNKILTSNAPDIIKGNQVDNFILKFVSQSSPVKSAYEVLKRVDMLLLKNDNEISILKSNGIVTPEQWSVHTFAYPLLMQMYEDDSNLFDEKDTGQIAEELKTKLSLIKPTTVTPLRTVLNDEFNAGAGAA